jgi:hypothetical protein
MDQMVRAKGAPVSHPDVAERPQPQFRSILFEETGKRTTDVAVREPDCFTDLNLDQIVETTVKPKQEYDLTPFFYRPLTNIEAVSYRHDVFHDFEKPPVMAAIKTFADRLRLMRDHLTESKKSYYKYQKEGWFLDAGAIYGEAVEALAADLRAADVRSRGLSSLGVYLSRYASEQSFVSLRADTKKLRSALGGVRYSLLIRSSSVQVRKYEGEPDYSTEVAATFEKFQQGQVEDFGKAYGWFNDMNHVEAAILEFVAKLHPDIFAALDAYHITHAEFLDPVIARFDREVQFYVAWLEHIATLKQTGLPFCYPQVSDTSKEVHGRECFDLALADKLVAENKPLVTNDFHLDGSERVFVISGPNQGGKTTFARTFGQLHYVAALGCPVPGREAQLFLFDKVFTHFEREEDIAQHRGKLEDDLIRIHQILDAATSNSIIVMNEIFTSTALSDAIVLGKRVMQRIIDLDLLCVCVTFIDELASLGDKVVSLASTVVPENPAERTYKIVRKAADGKAYAKFIAERYGLTFERIGERIKS